MGLNTKCSRHGNAHPEPLCPDPVVGSMTVCAHCWVLIPLDELIPVYPGGSEFPVFVCHNCARRYAS